MSTDEYVPSEAAVKLAWADRRLFLDSMGEGDPSPDAVYNAEFDRFLARVKRDAAREALTSMEEEHAEKAEKARVGGNATMHSIELVVAEAARQHRDTRHPIPEEPTP